MVCGAGGARRASSSSPQPAAKGGGCSGPAAPSPERSRPPLCAPGRQGSAPSLPPCPATPEVPRAQPPHPPGTPAAGHRRLHALLLHCARANHRDPLKRLARGSDHVTARRPPPPSYIRGSAPALRPGEPRGSRRSRRQAGSLLHAREVPGPRAGLHPLRAARRSPAAPGVCRKDGGGAGWTRRPLAGGESFRRLLPSGRPARGAPPPARPQMLAAETGGKAVLGQPSAQAPGAGAFAFSPF